MTKHMVAELEGALLDAAVAKAEGLSYDIRNTGPACVIINMAYSPSSQWDTGGKIIERESIRLPPPWATHSELWSAAICTRSPVCGWVYCEGNTPLIAAMRAYVKIKLGHEVEL